MRLRVRAVRIVLAAAACLLAAACGGSALETFDLTSPAVPPVHKLRAQLSVREPIASLELNSQRILVRTGPESVAYLAGAQWSDRLPVLVQTRLVQTFQNARLIQSVTRDGTGVAADYSLEMDIQAFEIDAKALQANVAIAAKILDARNGRVVGARIFEAHVPATGTDGPRATASLNAALAGVLTQIVGFVSAQL